MKLTSTRPSDRRNPPQPQTPPDQYGTDAPVSPCNSKGQTDANS